MLLIVGSISHCYHDLLLPSVIRCMKFPIVKEKAAVLLEVIHITLFYVIFFKELWSAHASCLAGFHPHVKHKIKV